MPPFFPFPPFFPTPLPRPALPPTVPSFLELVFGPRVRRIPPLGAHPLKAPLRPALKQFLAPSISSGQYLFFAAWSSSHGLAFPFPPLVLMFYLPLGPFRMIDFTRPIPAQCVNRVFLGDSYSPPFVFDVGFVPRLDVPVYPLPWGPLSAAGNILSRYLWVAPAFLSFGLVFLV